MKDKSLWITGSARGLGLEIAKQTAEKGMLTFFGSRNHSEYYIEAGYFDKSFLELENVHYIQCDISNRLSVDSAINEIQNLNGGVDILINNAGIVAHSSGVKITDLHLNEIFQTNFYGALYSAQAVLPSMIEQKFGAIINILSVTIDKAFPYIGAYAASKSALAVLFRSIREEVRKHGVKIVNFSPGAMSTEIWDEKVIKEKGNLMLTSKNTALAIYKIVEMCFYEDLLVEEFTLRPQLGDL